MTPSPLLLTTDAVQRLAARLLKCPDVVKESSEEAWTLAHALSDIEQSCRAFLDQLPKLLDPEVTDKQAFEVILDIGEEFRHILYHIRDPLTYSYLREP